MLKRRLDALDVSNASQGGGADSSLRCRKMEEYVSQALWRLQILNCDYRTVSYLSSSSSSSRTLATVRKTWVARLNPSVQLWYGRNDNGEERRAGCSSMRVKPLQKKKARKTTLCRADPLLVNRLLAEPLSILKV